MATLRLDNVSIGSLSGVNLSIPSGSILCVSGPSGSGKSQLLRAVADMSPHGGEVWLDDQAQNDMPAHEWRRQVMMVPADSQWWFDNVNAHFEEGAAQAVPEALGFGQEVMGWGVSRLSSGERQRLAILRSLARQPRVLLLDEPTANLDDEMTRRIERWLLSEIAARNLAVIWVAHDVSQITRLAGQHYHIHGHRLEQVDGSH